MRLTGIFLLFVSLFVFTGCWEEVNVTNFSINDPEVCSRTGNCSFTGTAEVNGLPFDPDNYTESDSFKYAVAIDWGDGIVYNANINDCISDNVCELFHGGMLFHHEYTQTGDYKVIAAVSEIWSFSYVRQTVDHRVVLETSPFKDKALREALGEVAGTVGATTDKGILQQGEWRHYGPFDTTKTRFEVTLETKSGDPDLYVRQGSAPDTYNWDCRPYLSEGDEICTSDNPGTMYVSVRGASANSEYLLKIREYDTTLNEVEVVKNSSISMNRWHDYGPYDPGSGELEAVINSTNGFAGLYLKKGAPARSEDYDCMIARYGGAATNKCTLSGPGQIYVSVESWEGTPTYELKVSYIREEPIYLENFDPSVVQTLDLSGKGITSLEGIQFLPNLTSLNISGNEIKSIKPLLRLPNLKSLDISNNPIGDFELLTQFTGLEYLFLGIEKDTQRRLEYRGSEINNFISLFMCNLLAVERIPITFNGETFYLYYIYFTPKCAPGGTCIAETGICDCNPGYHEVDYICVEDESPDETSKILYYPFGSVVNDKISPVCNDNFCTIFDASGSNNNGAFYKSATADVPQILMDESEPEILRVTNSNVLNFNGLRNNLVWVNPYDLGGGGSSSQYFNMTQSDTNTINTSGVSGTFLFNSSFTLSLWAKLENCLVACTLVDSFIPATKQVGLRIWWENTTNGRELKFLFDNNFVLPTRINLENYKLQYGNDDESRNNWFNISLTYTSSEINIYVNGMKAESIAKPIDTINPAVLVLGAASSEDMSKYGFFTGSMDEIKILNVKLDDYEVSALATGIRKCEADFHMEYNAYGKGEFRCLSNTKYFKCKNYDEKAVGASWHDFNPNGYVKAQWDEENREWIPGADSPGVQNCLWHCGSEQHIEKIGEKDHCVKNLRMEPCPPHGVENAVWASGEKEEKFEQEWTENSWDQPGPGECEWKCDKDFHNENDECISNTRDKKCGDIPSQGEYKGANENGMFKQTWNTETESWEPSDDFECEWDCKKAETCEDESWFRLGNSCINTKEDMKCHFEGNDYKSEVTYFYNVKNQDMEYRCRKGESADISSLGWYTENDKEITVSSKDECDAGNVDGCWEKIENCPCMKGTRKSTALSPVLTECVPYDAIDVADINFKLCLIEKIGWDKINKLSGDIAGSSHKEIPTPGVNDHRWYLRTDDVENIEELKCEISNSSNPQYPIGALKSVRGIEHLKKLKSFKSPENQLLDYVPFTRIGTNGYDGAVYRKVMCSKTEGDLKTEVVRSDDESADALDLEKIEIGCGTEIGGILLKMEHYDPVKEQKVKETEIICAKKVDDKVVFPVVEVLNTLGAYRTQPENLSKGALFNYCEKLNGVELTAGYRKAMNVFNTGDREVAGFCAYYENDAENYDISEHVSIKYYIEGMAVNHPKAAYCGGDGALEIVVDNTIAPFDLYGSSFSKDESGNLYRVLCDRSSDNARGRAYMVRESSFGCQKIPGKTSASFKIVFGYEKISPLEKLTLTENLKNFNANRIIYYGNSDIADSENTHVVSEINKSLSRLTNLTTLEFNYAAAKVKVSLRRISKLLSMKDLNLSENTFENTSGMKFLYPLTNLEYLDISKTNLIELHPDSSKTVFPKLSSLKATDNSKFNIYGIQNMPSLRFLDISNNGYEEGDLSSLNNVQKLKYLNISKNPIKNLKAISSLDNLEVLDASSCNLNSLGYISTLNKLKRVNLSVNTDIGGNKTVKNILLKRNLEVLDISGCGVDDNDLILNEGFESKIFDLKIFDNKIGKTSFLKQLPHIRSLDISKNYIADPGVLGDTSLPPFNISVLNISENCFTGADVDLIHEKYVIFNPANLLNSEARCSLTMCDPASKPYHECTADETKDCSTISDELTGNISCDSLCRWDTSKCEKAAVCGNGEIEDGENCEKDTSIRCGELGYTNSENFAPCGSDCKNWESSGCIDFNVTHDQLFPNYKVGDSYNIYVNADASRIGEEVFLFLKKDGEILHDGTSLGTLDENSSLIYMLPLDSTSVGYYTGEQIAIGTPDSARSISRSFRVSQKKPETCGNGDLDSNEICDGTEKACSELGGLYESGTATCAEDCLSWNVSGCTAVEPSCGNRIIEESLEEICDSNRVECSVLDSEKYTSGYAYCNDTCKGWDISSCKSASEVCGNGVVESDAGEICDGNTISCKLINSSFVSGAATCNENCRSWDTTSCEKPAEPVCGNGIIEDSEDCEIGETKNCTDIDANYKSKEINCVDCKWDQTVCETAATCGNGTVEPGEECDNGNADGQGEVETIDCSELDRFTVGTATCEGCKWNRSGCTKSNNCHGIGTKPDGTYFCICNTGYHAYYTDSSMGCIVDDPELPVTEPYGSSEEDEAELVDKCSDYDISDLLNELKDPFNEDMHETIAELCTSETVLNLGAIKGKNYISKVEEGVTKLLPNKNCGKFLFDKICTHFLNDAISSIEELPEGRIKARLENKEKKYRRQKKAYDPLTGTFRPVVKIPSQAIEESTINASSSIGSSKRNAYATLKNLINQTKKSVLREDDSIDEERDKYRYLDEITPFNEPLGNNLGDELKSIYAGVENAFYSSSDDNVYVPHPAEKPSNTDYQFASKTDLLKFLKLGGTEVTRLDAVPGTKIESCEQFVYQKYFEYSRFMDYAALYEDQPFDLVNIVFHFQDDEFFTLKSFAGTLDVHVVINNHPRVGYSILDTNSYADVSERRRGGGLFNHKLFPENVRVKNYALTNDTTENPIRIEDNRKSRNIFFEIVSSMKTSPEDQDEKLPHMMGGLFAGEGGIQLPDGIDPSQASDYSCLYNSEIGEIECGSNATKATFEFYSKMSEIDGNLSREQVKKGLMYAQGMKNRIKALLLNRAAVEHLWNKKREQAFKSKFSRYDAESYYGVRQIPETAFEIVKKLPEYAPVKIPDDDEPYYIKKAGFDDLYEMLSTNVDENGNEITKEEIIQRAKERAQKLALQKMEDDLTQARFMETDEGKSLWGPHHFGKSGYLNPGFQSILSDPRNLFPQPDTELLIEKVLEQIDEEIEETINNVNDKSPKYIMQMNINGQYQEIPAEEKDIKIDCFSTSSPNKFCDWDPADFIEDMRTLIPSAEMQEDLRICEEFTSNDPKMFKESNDPEKDTVASFREMNTFKANWPNVMCLLGDKDRIDPDKEIKYLYGDIKNFIKQEVVEEGEFNIGNHFHNSMYNYGKYNVVGYWSPYYPENKPELQYAYNMLSSLDDVFDNNMKMIEYTGIERDYDKFLFFKVNRKKTHYYTVFDYERIDDSKKDSFFKYTGNTKCKLVGINLYNYGANYVHLNKHGEYPDDFTIYVKLKTGWNDDSERLIIANEDGYHDDFLFGIEDKNFFVSIKDKRHDFEGSAAFSNNIQHLLLDVKTFKKEGEEDLSSKVTLFRKDGAGSFSFVGSTVINAIHSQGKGSSDNKFLQAMKVENNDLFCVYHGSNFGEECNSSHGELPVITVENVENHKIKVEQKGIDDFNYTYEDQVSVTCEFGGIIVTEYQDNNGNNEIDEGEFLDKPYEDDQDNKIDAADRNPHVFCRAAGSEYKEGWRLGTNSKHNGIKGGRPDLFFIGEIHEVGIFKNLAKTFSGCEDLDGNNGECGEVITRLANGGPLREAFEWGIRQLDNKFLEAVISMYEGKPYDKTIIAKYNENFADGKTIIDGFTQHHYGLLNPEMQEQACGYKFPQDTTFDKDRAAALADLVAKAGLRQLTHVSGETAYDYTSDWQDMELLFMLNDVWNTERQEVRRRIKHISKGLKQKISREQAIMLKKVVNAASPGLKSTSENGDENGESSKDKGYIGKFFSDFSLLGHPKAGIEFSYIAGFALRNLSLDWGRFNPIKDLQDTGELLKHIMTEAILTAIEKARDELPDEIGVYKGLASGNSFSIGDLPDEDLVNAGADVYRELRRRMESAAQCVLEPQNNSKGVKQLMSAVEQMISMVKGFDTTSLSSSLQSAIPDIKPEDFLYALAEEVLIAGLRERGISIMNAGDNFKTKIENSFNNDVQKITQYLKSYENSLDEIDKILNKIRSGEFFNPSAVTSFLKDKAVNEIKRSLAKQVYIELLALNTPHSRAEIENFIKNKPNAWSHVTESVNKIIDIFTNDAFFVTEAKRFESMIENIANKLHPEKLSFDSITMIDLTTITDIPEFAQNINYGDLSSYFIFPDNDEWKKVINKCEDWQTFDPKANESENSDQGETNDDDQKQFIHLPILTVSMIKTALTDAVSQLLDVSNVSALELPPLKPLPEFELPSTIAALKNEGLNIHPLDIEEMKNSIKNAMTGVGDKISFSATILKDTFARAAKKAYAVDAIAELFGKDTEDLLKDIYKDIYGCILEEVNLKKPELEGEVNLKIPEIPVFDTPNLPFEEMSDNCIAAIADNANNISDKCKLFDSFINIGKEFPEIITSALMKRAEEILFSKLMELPNAEFIGSMYSGIRFFGYRETLFEASMYLTTSTVINETTNSYVNLEGVNEKARKSFVERSKEKNENGEVNKIVPLKPYDKFYATEIQTSFEDVGKAAMEKVKQEAKDRLTDAVGKLVGDDVKNAMNNAMSAVNSAYNELSKETNSDFNGTMQNMLKDSAYILKKDAEEQAKALKGNSGTTKKGVKDYLLLDGGFDGDYQTVIVIVPVAINYGVSLRAGVELTTDYSYKLPFGFGMKSSVWISPYLGSEGYVTLAVGLDTSFLKLKAGAFGHVVFFRFDMPFVASAILKPKYESGDITANFNFRVSLSPKLTVLDAEFGLFAEASVMGFGERWEETLLDLPPLYEKDFGNVLPIPTLDINLFSLGEALKVIE